MVWGVTFAVVKETTREVPVPLFLALRFSIAGAVLLLLYPRRVAALRARDFGWASLLGLVLAAGFLMQTLGLQTISASRSAFLTGLSVILVPFLAIPIVGSRPGPVTWLGVLLAASGTWVLTGGGVAGPSSGDLWSLGCMAAFALQIVLLSRFVRNADPIAIAVVEVAAGAVLFWAYAVQRGPVRPDLPGSAWGAILFMAVIGTAFTQAGQAWGQKRATPVRAGVVYSLEPVFAALYAAAALSERLVPREWAGASLIFAAVLLVEVLGRGDR
jgi:drug/metabolite transporter (DMT)-like permease